MRTAFGFVATLCVLAPAAALCACSDDDDGPRGSRRKQDASTPSAARDAGDPDAPAADDPTAVFVAFAADFRGFRSWPSYDVTLDDDAGPQHPEQRLTEYINVRPRHAAEVFPWRTIIVKEGTDPKSLNYFAMVKRGGDFNSEGARGWEWFELQDVEDGGVLIVWRGVGPPADEGYGGDPLTGCNECHTPDNNDCVLAPALDLRNF